MNYTINCHYSVFSTRFLVSRHTVVLPRITYVCMYVCMYVCVYKHGELKVPRVMHLSISPHTRWYGCCCGGDAVEHKIAK